LLEFLLHLVLTLQELALEIFGRLVLEVFAQIAVTAGRRDVMAVFRQLHFDQALVDELSLFEGAPRGPAHNDLGLW
jgi:hypothetical protein